MLLTALLAQSKADGDRLPEFHSTQTVRYRLNLSTTGRAPSVKEMGEDGRGMQLPIPYVQRSGTAAKPMVVDRGDYVLGVPSGRTDDERAKNASRTANVHAAYVALIHDAAQATGLEALWALHRFATTVDPAALELPPAFDASRFVAIYVDGELISTDPVVTQWWIDRQRARDAAITGTCAVCGASCSPVETIPVQIRGLTRIGGKATMALISANVDTFERHGLPRAAGASICLDCGNATHQALNQLIDDRRHAVSLGNTLYVWWPTEPVEVPLLDALLLGDGSEDVRATLDAIRTGRLSPRIAASRFYAASLGANAARVVVRSWTDITLVDAFRNIARWFQRTAVVGPYGTAPRQFGVFSLVTSLAPPGSGSPLARVDPGLPETLLRAAVTGARLPPAVLAHVLARLRARQGEIGHARAALLKACITPPENPDPEDSMTALDLNTTDPAYRCGRLLALLDDAARLATTRNNSLVNRSYAAASTMPQITLTRLLRLHRAHMDKLMRDRRGAAIGIDADVTEVLAGLTALPPTLTPSEQARFALGLYHQQAASRARARAAKEARLLGKADEHAEALADIHPETEDTNR